MFEQTNATEDRDRLTDWVLRGGVALVFVLFGMEKLQSRPDGSWVKFFAAIGFRQWFRYATGTVVDAPQLQPSALNKRTKVEFAKTLQVPTTALR
jgi:hypothetical protein